MNKKNLILLAGVVLFGCGVAHAILPPDASEREPQLRRERIEANRKYERYLEEQRAIAVQRHRDVMAGLDYPPWKTTETGAPKPGADLSKRTWVLDEKIGHNWRLGLMGLLFIGALFWFIKQMTRGADRR